MNASRQVENALDQCRQHGMRRTHALRVILNYLARRNRPVNWATLAEAPEMRETCNPSSAFRLLIRLEKTGIVRRLPAPDRCFYFVFNEPGKYPSYLLCRICGEIEQVTARGPCGDLDFTVSRRTGYVGVRHELIFFGVCPRCQNPASPQISKRQNPVRRSLSQRPSNQS